MKITPRLASFFRTSQSCIAFAVLATVSFSTSASATDGVWNSNSSTVWSIDTNWLDNDIADGIGSIADFSLLNITSGTRTVTIDGLEGSRTVGTLLIGDSDATDNRSYTIAANSGGDLTFDNGGSGALLSQISTSNGDSITAPVVLNDNLTVSNAAAVKSLTINPGVITSGTAGTKTLTTTTGGVTISGSIDDGLGTVAVVQDGDGTLTLSNVNTFTGGLTAKSGTIFAGNNATALGGNGTGAVTIGGGAPSGAANASLLGINNITYANPITVAAGGTGLYTIGNNTSGNAHPRFSGGITLDNALTIAESNIPQGGVNTGTYVIVSGEISGTGNLTLAGNGAISTNNSGQPSAINNIDLSGPVSTTGSITNDGVGNAYVQISGVISNTSGVVQNSATSRLALTNANTYTGPTNINAGVLRITNSAAIATSSAVTVASGATLQIGSGSSPLTSPTLSLSGNGSYYSTGALQGTNNSAYLGNVFLAANSTISSDLGNTTLTVGTVGSSTITGSGKNLTTTGAGNVTLSGSLDTGAGTLTKLGTGNLTLSGANSFTGLTSINEGALVLNISTALDGGGNITFGGGTLKYTSNNNVDYSDKIVNSTSAISIDTNGQNRTFSSGIAASNTGGLTKIGSGTLTLSGTNSYAGATIVSGGQLAVTDASALPGTVVTDVTGAVNQGGAYTDVQGWLDSGKVATGSVGAIALTGASSEDIDFTGFNNLMLGASTNVNYTGTITPADGTYRLGGGSGTITLTNTNALTGGNDLVVGARIGNASAGGGVTLGAANDMTGTTTVASGTMTLNSGSAGVANSDVSVNTGTTLAINYASGNLGGDNSVTRAKSVQLNGATLTVSGNTGGNSTEVITNALAIGSGSSIITISSATGKRALLGAGSFARNSGGVVLFRGTSLGVEPIATLDVSSAGISFGASPTLNGTGTAGGSAGTTTVGVLAGTLGDTVTNGSGLGSTGGLVTYDATYGVRLLDTSTEYTAAVVSGQTQLDNVRYENATGSLVTTTLGTATSINSLSFASTGTGGVTIDGAGALQINSGVVYNAQIATNTVTISNTGGLDFNGQEAVFLNQNSGTFTISNVVGNATGLTKSGSGMLILSGADANTYSGTTTVNGGDLRLAKSTGVNAVTGDLVINTGGNVSMSNSDQIADTSNVTLDGGRLILAPSTNNNGGRNETINNLTMVNGGSLSYGQSYGNPIFTVLGSASVTGGSTLFQNSGGQLNITGLTSLSDEGTLTVKRSQSPSSVYDGFVTLGGGLNITNTATGAYTPVRIDPGINIAQIGGKLFLDGDLAFTGTSNPNTVTITAPTGFGPQGVMALSGNRTFAIDDGAAAVDLTVDVALVDGSTTGGLVKTGAGTMALTTANSYTGNTTVSTGTLNLATPTLDNASTVNVGSTAVLHLAHGVTDVVGDFQINGVSQGSGTFNAGNTGGRITGTGSLQVGSSSDPFVAWIDTFTNLVNPADKTKDADPDMDGVNNFAEFALNGNPDDGSNYGLKASLLQDTTAPAGNELTYVIAVRDGASFAAGPGAVQTATVAPDGLTYTVEGSLDLVFPGSAVSHVSTTDTAPVATGLPDLTGTSWEYHTFRLDASEGLNGKGFLRVATQPAP